MSEKKWWLSIHRYFFIALLFGAGIAVVSSFYPREGKFRYEYQKGKPWMQEVLIAPWDFPIYKSEAERHRERDSIQQSFKPFYDIDTSRINYELNSFYSYYNELRLNRAGDVRDLSNVDYEIIRSEISGILDDVYSVGICEVDDRAEQLRQDDRDVILVKGTLAEEVKFNTIYTHKSAYEIVKERKNNLLLDSEESVDLRLFEFISTVNLFDFVKPNVKYNSELTDVEQEKQLNSVSLTRGLIQKGELIISRGELVNDFRFRVLESLRVESGAKVGSYNSWLLILGQVLLVASCFLVLFLFLWNFRVEVLDSFAKTLFIVLLIVSFTALTKLALIIPEVSVYIIPFAIIPIVIRTFYDPRLALFILLVNLMLIGFIVPNSFEFVFVNFIAGVVVIFSLTNTYRRGKLFLSASMVFIAMSVVYFGIGIIQEGEIKSIDYYTFAWFAGNTFLILLSYPLIFIFEKTFGFLSDATLFELSDTNQPLLRRLAEEAPGSFQHSMQVANLVEDAVRVVGGNPLLVRAGALYHDIGKVNDSEYFTENQADGFNPHDNIAPDESAKIIIDHISKGLELARKSKLPEQIIDFIRTHQGTTKTYYFYREFKDKNPDMKVDYLQFSYPGPRPFTKETALMMMADSVEAASRSLKEYSEGTIKDLVESIIDHQMQEDQFVDAPITFQDIRIAKKAFVKRLMTIYHARIVYPKKDDEEEKKNDPYIGNNKE
ncbi:MAG: HDIG domain-containing protein [Bacteroidales bacterium]|nr:HDIG domain-containing protein [Bacteroidales bacterium]